MPSQISDISVRRINGQMTNLSEYSGKVLLVVNVASQCGFTPQYDGLEKIYEKYKEQGLVVIGFPANEFGAQEPGSNNEIMDFCRANFGVQFPMFEKIVVKGQGQHPLYQKLTEIMPKAVKKPESTLEENLKGHGLLSGGSSDILWNFEKFIVNRKGEVVGRFAPDIAPEDPLLIQALEAELKNRN